MQLLQILADVVVLLRPSSHAVSHERHLERELFSQPPLVAALHPARANARIAGSMNAAYKTDANNTCIT